jgi:peptidoglycan hydrolase-like protein with peptidoglycan-binding domain
MTNAPAAREINVPAEYSTYTRRQLVKAGGFSEWREVVCGTNITESNIRKLQHALKNRGYDPGPADNVFGAQTKAALIKYQKDKGLPVGNLDMETMKSLGLNFNN